MRKFVVTIMASLLSCSTAFAFWPEAVDSSLEVGVGYRRDNIQWKTKAGFDGYGYDDNEFTGLKSHLKWKRLNIWQIQAKGKYVTCDNIYLRASGDYGWITSGKNTDSDFLGNGYEDIELAHSRSKVKGHVYDAKLAIGYQFKMNDDLLAVTPLVGYSWHGQHLHDRHLRHAIGGGYEAVEEYTSSYGSDSHGRHRNRYHTRWNGPFVGVDFDYLLGCFYDWDWQFFGDYEFHWAQYHAKADFGLRRDLFDGFHHRARNAYGHVLDLGVKWDFCECWTLAVKGEFQWWWADKGRDRAKLAETSAGNVKTDCYVKIPLRDLKWHSAGVSVNLGMVF